MRKLILFLILLSLSFGGYFVYQNFFAKHSSIYNIKIPNGFKSVGIDISHHQGNINWETVFSSQQKKDAIKFVYCKATEGKNHVDRKWGRNRKWLNKNKIKNGAYHFFSTKSYAKPQAEHFLKFWKKETNDLPPVLDIETEGISDEDLIAKMKVWLEFVEKKSGMRPIIYTSHHFYKTKFKNHFKKYKFWIAAYSRKPLSILDERVIHWQFSERGSVNGVDELVDFNVSKIEF